MTIRIGQGARFSAGTFYPTDVSGCSLWLRADMGVTLVEPVVAAPNDISSGSWSKANSSATNTYTLQDTNDGGAVYHYIEQTVTNLRASNEATITLEIKSGTKTQIQVNLSGSKFAIFDTSDGSVYSTNGTASTTSLGGGWWSASLTAVPVSGVIQLLIASGGTSNYQGNGTGTILIRNVNVTQYNVSSWANQASGWASSVSQGTAANRPLWQPAGFNNMPCLDFSETLDHYLTGTGGSINSEITLFAAVAWDDSATENYQYALTLGEDTGNYTLYTITRDDNISQTYYSYPGGAIPASDGTYVYVDSTNHIVTAKYINDSQKHYAWHDGTADTVEVLPSLCTVTNRVTVGTYVGSGPTFTGNFNGRVAELIGFNSPLNDTNRQRVQQYMGSRYSIVVA